jgi:pimeloyl-ACP methyl ester carboxylesterase
VQTIGLTTRKRNDYVSGCRHQGHKIFYREAGSITNPTIVLLRGFPMPSHMFRELMPQLASHFHVVVSIASR